MKTSSTSNYKNRICSIGALCLTRDSLQYHEKGATLLEAIMVLAIFGALFVVVSQFVSFEQEKQMALLIGKETAFLTQATQRYVGIEYDTLRENLFANATDTLRQVISIKTISDAGYVSATLLENDKFINALEQEYTLLIRGVNANDINHPQTTLTVPDVDANTDGQIDAFLLDGNLANGELELEAILITSNGEDVFPQIAGKVIAGAGLYSMGYSQSNGIAKGPYGTWELNTSPYSGMEGYDSTRSLVSLISLSRSGVFGYPEQREETLEGEIYLDRCDGKVGSILTTCKNNNQLFTEIVFNSFDEDGDGFADFFGQVEGLYALHMGPPVDTDGDMVPDRYGMITNLLGVSCDKNHSSYAEDRLNVTCDSVNFSKDVEVGEDLTVNGDIVVTGTVRAERFIADALGGQDLTKGIFYADIVDMSKANSIPKPNCKDSDSEPQIYVSTISHRIPGGFEALNVQGKITNQSNGWTVSMQAEIDRDRNNDGYNDIISLTSSEDRIQVLTRCS